MELKSGYKISEVGSIPEDWDVKKVGDLCDFVVPGRNKPKAFNGDIPWITTPDIDSNIVAVSKQNLFITKEEAKNVGSKIVLKNSVIIACVGDLGIATIAGKDIVINQQLHAFLPNERINHQYLYYALIRQKNYMESVATKTAVPYMNKDNCNSIPIPLPPTKAEQTLIATALSDADELINSLEELISKKRNIKHAAMKKLLQPKENWEQKRLGDFLDYEQPTEYLVSDTEYNDNNQTPVLTAGKTFILGYTHEEHGIFTNLPVIIFDDFTTAIKFVDFPFKAKSSAMKMLVPINDKVNLRFIYEIMLQIKSPLGDHKRHWIAEFQHLEVSVPSSPEEQTFIANILSDMDAEITALETKLEKYRKIKSGMMQNLLTGKIRLV